MPLLALPLYVPVLIFGVAAATGDLGPTGNGPARLILLGLALLLGAVQPWASAAAIRAYFR